MPYFAEYFGHKKYNTIWKMPSVILENYHGSESIGQDEWPNDFMMFEPLEVNQSLFYEKANSLSVKTYFKMIGVDLNVQQLPNTEYLVPKGGVPVVVYGSYFITDLVNIASFVKEKALVPNDDLEDEERSDMRTFMSLVNNQLFNYELYLSWADEYTYSTVTWEKYGSVYPFPLNYILTWRKKRSFQKKLEVLNIKFMSIDQVLEEMRKCLGSLSTKLAQNEWFLKKPTELDALVFGHVSTILSYPDDKVSQLINDFPNLKNFCKRVHHRYFENVTK